MSHPSSSKPSQYSTNDNSISRPVQRHLVHVFLALAAMLGIAAYGSVAETPRLLMGNNGSIETIGAVASAVGVVTLRRGNRWRWPLLATYSLFSGMSLSALVYRFLYLDPSGTLLLSILTGAMFIFLGLSTSALLANRRSMIYVGGIVGSLLGLLAWTSLANVFFFQSPGVFSAELYMGLLAFSGFVIYDTQMIVERASAGILDIPGNAIELFMDLLQLFVRLALIYLRRQEDRRGRRGRDDDDDNGNRGRRRRGEQSYF
ncbi:inhibitor of apoptosis-promoting Bax1-domain-containing protein [Dichotomocladium elegans]|nr:inhibitor of apoptosis-promoting Bax1-domain-containing protein [Dichotomocladium elegans]